jgi:nucleoside-diphosphate-sugar epimerase
MTESQQRAGAIQRVLVTGGAGYVGSALVPKLLERGYHVKVLDLFLFGEEALAASQGHPGLTLIRGDIRDRATLESTIRGMDAVIHLACISNDPSFELNPGLGRSINYDAFFPLVDISKESGVQRFIYASSSSVYGIKDEPNVTEDLPLRPLTDYSKYKALCEEVLEKKRAPGFTTLTLRPATVCGYAPRLRLDLTVNILTNHAVNTGQIKVFGGAQLRPNIHVQDMADLYVEALGWPAAAIDGRVYNAGYHNKSVAEIAETVKEVLGRDIQIVTTPTDDNRSYHISSEKLKRELGFEAQRSIEDAVRDLVTAFERGRVPNAMSDDRYYNIRTMQRVNLQ